MLKLDSKITRVLLSYYFLHEDESYYINDLVRKLKIDKRNLVKKLREFEKVGLLVSDVVGNLKYYRLNKNYPLYREYRQIVMKTLGLEGQLRDIFTHFPGINRAIIFGSYAQNTMDTASDIDILVIGNHDTIKLQKALTALQRTIDREINLISIDQPEFDEKMKNNDPLLKEIMSNPIVEIL